MHDADFAVVNSKPMQKQAQPQSPRQWQKASGDNVQLFEIFGTDTWQKVFERPLNGKPEQEDNNAGQNAGQQSEHRQLGKGIDTGEFAPENGDQVFRDRKSTRLNSSHVRISY